MTDGSDIEEFFAHLAVQAGTAPVTREEAEAVLDLAREVAHNVERKYAPVAAYALGLAVGEAEPAARVETAKRVIEAVRSAERR